MSQADLAKAAAVFETTIATYETSLSFTPEEEDLDAIRNALEKAGVEFTNGDRAWVRLRK